MSYSKNGNVVLIAVVFIALILIIFILIGAIFMGTINSIIHDVKLDMYSINKSAIIAVNKGVTSRGSFSYDIKSYKQNFEKVLKNNYNLDEKLTNKNGLIQDVEIIEYDIYEIGKRDNYIKKKQKDTSIHSVIKIKIKPIFMEEILEDVFTFYVHEDVVLNKVVGV